MSATLSPTPEVARVRMLFVKAAENEPECKMLLKILNGYSEKSHPLYAGYKAGATMLMAKYTLNPFSKLSYFNRGKALLERSIAADSENIELRLLRYSIQFNAPAFLGYRNHLMSDRAFIDRHMHRVQDVQLKQMIAVFLKTGNR